MEQKIRLTEATELIESWLAVKLKRKLNSLERALILAAWQDRLYDDVAEELELSPTYLKQKGQVFWKTLGLVLNQPISKKTMKAAVLQKRAELLKTQPSLAEILERDPDTKITKELVILGRKPPFVDRHFGYNPELADLRQSILENQCVVLVGGAGVGKTTLVTKLLESFKAVPENIPTVIWQSVRAGLPLKKLLNEVLECLEIEKVSNDIDVLIGQLIKKLSQERYLLVLDGAESILAGTEKSNLYGENEDYRSLLWEVIERSHISSVLLTSREPFRDLAYAESRGLSVRNISLRGLGKDAYGLLKSQRLTVDQESFRGLIELYRGNPLALKLVAGRIRKFFGGNVQQFLDCKTTWMGGSIQDALDDQFKSGSWSRLERELMHYLATQEQDSILFQDAYEGLKFNLADSVSMTEFIEATEVLCDRSLLERTESEESQAVLSLQPIIKKYVLSDPSGVIEQSLAA